MAIKNDNNFYAFGYRAGKSFVHKCQPSLKILLIFPLSIAAAYMSFYAVSISIFLMSALSFICGFSLKLQISDIKPIRYYFVFLYIVIVLTKFIDNNAIFNFSIFLIDIKIIVWLLRLVLIMQISALIFHSTTTTEIRQGISIIEQKIRSFLNHIPFIRKHISTENHFADLIALFFNFIPAIFEIWQNCLLAFKSRGGKGFMQKAKFLIPVFISLSFNYADLKAQAFKARR
jgi:energy-coupling factor transporter transmembrane protein EcfT